MHFYHKGIDGQQLDAIKLEQAQAWFELNRFVTETWREQFAPFLIEFHRMERNLIESNQYAQVKYNNLKPKIEGLKIRGKTFENCPKCKTNACLVEQEAPHLMHYDCMVCFYSEKQVQINCPACGNPEQYVVAYDGFSCDKCECQIVAQSDLFDFLDQNRTRGTKNHLDSNTPANCDECQGYHTVCEYQGGYLCTNCLSYFGYVDSCQWCNEPMTGDTEHTYTNGCEHCEGYIGYSADD